MRDAIVGEGVTVGRGCRSSARAPSWATGHDRPRARQLTAIAPVPTGAARSGAADASL